MTLVKFPNIAFFTNYSTTELMFIIYAFDKIENKC